jgi:RNA-directed DNA polymerase
VSSFQKVNSQKPAYTRLLTLSRHRLRAVQLKQWKRGTTMYRELLALGAKPDVAHKVAANNRRWWRNSGMLLNSVLTLNWFDRLGLPRLS